MDRVVSMTDARATLHHLLVEATQQEVFIACGHEPVGVLLNVAKYEALLDRLEDYVTALTCDPADAVPWEHARQPP